MSAPFELPPSHSLAGLYLAYLLDTGEERAIMPKRIAIELARLGWLASFSDCAYAPAFGWAFLVARSLIAAHYPGADEIDPDTGRQCCQALEEFVNDAFLAAEG